MSSWLSNSINVSSVVENALCIGCGACELACDACAIEMLLNRRTGLLEPCVDASRCTECGQCLYVCFGASTDFPPSSRVKDYYAKTIGRNKSYRSGHALSQEIRYHSSSGGVVTAILQHLLDTRIVKGAVVAESLSGNPPISRSFIARSSDEIFGARGSKYCPVYIASALKEMVDGENYAFVGLPCHIYAVTQLAKIRRIRGTVSIYIGLMCGGVPNYNAISYLLGRSGIHQANVDHIEYRGGGWPGRMILLVGNDKLEIPFTRYWPMIAPWFHLDRCATCLSGLNPRADISCGDYWLPEVIRRDKVGTSFIISRSTVGERILQLADEAGYVETELIPRDSGIRYQRTFIEAKHPRLMSRLKLLDAFRQNHVFVDSTWHAPPNLRKDLDEILLKIGRLLASREGLWPLFHSYTQFICVYERLSAVFNKRLRRPSD